MNYSYFNKSSNYLDDLSILERVRQENSTKGQHPLRPTTLKLEIKNFIQETKRFVDVKDPLVWWPMHGNEYPRVKKLAEKVLSLTASSSPCERLFKMAKIVLEGRYTLSADSTEDSALFSKNFSFIEEMGWI